MNALCFVGYYIHTILLTLSPKERNMILLYKIPKTET